MNPESSRESKWRQVLGVITKSEVELVRENYRPIVEYTYEVDGITYKGDTIAKGLITFNWSGPANRMVNRFPVGAQVTVYVDRKNPRHAVLQPGIDKKLPIFLVVFLGILMLIIFSYISGK
jgi:hypothetical protein